MISILSSDILTIKKISWDVAHCCPTVLSQVQLFQSKELQLQVCWTPLAAIQHELESNRHGLDAWFPTRKVVGWKGQHTTTRQHNKRHNIPHVSQKLSNDSQNCQFLFVSLHMSTVFSSVFLIFCIFLVGSFTRLRRCHLFGMEIGLVGKFSDFCREGYVAAVNNTDVYSWAENVEAFLYWIEFFTIFSSSEWVKTWVFCTWTISSTSCSAKHSWTKHP